jgi:acyl carrier protein phosphodiesterase
MNHLAHCVLAGPEPELILGGLLGDFARGAPDPAWPARLRDGVRLHRAIDTFTDAHAATVAARALFDAPFRRYAGIILDVWFDHLLARDFERRTGEPLRVFVERVYALLRADDPLWPASFRIFAARIAAHDGLAAYESRDHVEFVLERIGARLSRANPLDRALPAIEAVEGMVNREFERLWPALVGAPARARLLAGD